MKKIAIQGIRGSFHDEAAGLYYKQPISLVECLEFHEITEAVQQEDADEGIMAVENALAGCILPNLALIRNASLKIVGELYMPIRQHLLALPGETIQSIREIHSHPMAIMQCETFLRSLPNIRIVETQDTALSAKEITENKWLGIAAIGAARAASMYGLEIIGNSIETHKENYTRFLILSKHSHTCLTNIAVKATIAFTAAHTPGSLARILNELALEGVNLTMIQSLPRIGTKWEYVFHADLVFESADKAFETIKKMRSGLQQVWVLGVYPDNSFPAKESIKDPFCESDKTTP